MSGGGSSASRRSSSRSACSHQPAPEEHHGEEGVHVGVLGVGGGGVEQRGQRRFLASSDQRVQRPSLVRERLGVRGLVLQHLVVQRDRAVGVALAEALARLVELLGDRLTDVARRSVALVAPPGRLGDEQPGQAREGQHAQDGDDPTAGRSTPARPRAGSATVERPQRPRRRGRCSRPSAWRSRARRRHPRRARARGPRATAAGSRARPRGRTRSMRSPLIGREGPRRRAPGRRRSPRCGGARRQRANAALSRPAPPRGPPPGGSTRGRRSPTRRGRAAPARRSWRAIVARTSLGAAPVLDQAGDLDADGAGRGDVGVGDRLAGAHGALQRLGDGLDLLRRRARRAVVERGPHERHEHQRGDDDPAAAPEPSESGATLTGSAPRTRRSARRARRG